jgi:hypothetical protein
MHGPQHVVVPFARVADEQRVLDPSPGHAVRAHGMGDEVMIGQHQMEEVIGAVMIDDIDVTDVGPQEAM